MFKMTPNILRNLVSQKATRRYPYIKRDPFEGVRGELVNDIEQCTFCRVCAVKCPTQCIAVDKKQAVWTCDPFVCIYCSICVDACPAKCLHQKPSYRPPVSTHQLLTFKGKAKPA